MSNEVKFKYGDASAYAAKVATEGGVDASALYFVSKDISTNDGVDFGGTIYRGNDALGTTCADHLKTTEMIEIVGGPLANDIAESKEEWPWVENGKKVIPAGKSIQEILAAMFLKVVSGTVKWGSVSWDPAYNAPTVTLSPSDSKVEVGTKIKVTGVTAGSVKNNTRSATCTTTQGYFLADASGNVTSSYQSGNKTVSKDGSVSEDAISYAYTWKGAAQTVTLNETELEVTIVGDNKLVVTQSGQTASVDALGTVNVIAATNTKQVVENLSATDASAKLVDETKPSDKAVKSSSTTKTITGAYKYFIGCYSDDVFANKTYTTTSVRTTDVDKSDWMNGKTINYTITVPAGTKGMYIAIPEGTDDNGASLKVKQVNTNAYVNEEMVTNKRTLSLTCGGTHTKNYVIFTWSFPGGTTGSEPFEITSF